MNYEKKYKETLEKVKGFLKRWEDVEEANSFLVMEEVKDIFPELKESEDEMIRKTIIRFFKDQYPNETEMYDGFVTVGKAIDWLEKQGEIDKTSYEIAEREKDNFVSGQFIECRKSFNEFKEDSSYWLEYVGNDTYIGRSDNILNKKFHITPRQLYCLFTQQHCSKENNVNEETNAPTGYGKYVNECLSDAAKHFFSEGEDRYSIADLFYSGVRCEQSWLEKQGEQKAFDYKNATIVQKDFASEAIPQIEPKFKVGDWILIYNPCQIECIDNYGNYIVRYCDMEETTILPRDFCNSHFHLWSIADANDGDVLYSLDSNQPFIYKERNIHEQATAYCGINKYGNFSVWNTKDCITTLYKYLPATKEQRDTLFAKMKEAGYEWDAEKKEIIL